MKKFFFILFSIFQILNILPRDLIIGGKISEQSRWFDKKTQKFTGFDVEIIDYIFSELGIPYQIILENSSARLEHGWKSEKPFYDMVFTYSKKEERKKYLIYPLESHISIEWHFFIRKEDEGKYKFDSYKDLQGLRIGYTRGQSYTVDFMQALKNKTFFGDEVVKDELQITKLLNGRIDMAPLSTSTTLYKASKNGYLDKITYLSKPMKSEAYYNVFVKKSDYPGLKDIIKNYDAILYKMKTEGILQKIRDKYDK